MKEWFLENQAKLALVVGAGSVLLTVVVGDARWPGVLAAVIIATILAFIASRLYAADTTENWLDLSYGNLIRNILCGVFTLIGWTLLLRGALALALGAAFLKMG